MYGRIEMIGCLGVGKSTLLKACQIQKVESYCIFENLDEIAEELTYWRQQPSERTYFIQTVYYFTAHNLLRSKGNPSNKDSVILTDFSLLFHHYGYSYVFKEYNLLSHLEYRILEVLLSLLQLDIPTLIGVVYCKASSKTILGRIRGRNRLEESDINVDFVSRLANACDRMLPYITCPVLELDLDSYDLNTAADAVGRFVKGLTNQ